MKVRIHSQHILDVLYVLQSFSAEFHTDFCSAYTLFKSMAPFLDVIPTGLALTY